MRSQNSPNSLPESHEDRVKCLNTIGSGCLGKCSEGEGSDGANLLLFVDEAILDYLDKALEVR